MKRCPAHANIIALLLETFVAILHSLNHRLKVVELGLQVADEQRRLAGRGYGCCVIRIEG